MKFAVHQYHYSVRGADAVTNHLLLIRAALQEVGIEGKIFASHFSGNPPPSIERFERQNAWDCDLLLLHHSHGNPKLDDVLGLEVPKALVYHNITPASFMRHDPNQAELCALGREQLKKIRSYVCAAWADSLYNASELKTLGYASTQVFPLVDLNAMTKQYQVTQKEVSRKRPILLFVGKICRHKNQALLVKAFYYFKKLEPNAELRLVGGEELVYGKYLRHLAKSLGLADSVVFAGTVSQAELIQNYCQADAFVCTSLHEGFCVPLVEAMDFGVPVFALPIPGVLGTLQRSGIHFHSRRPDRIAAVIAGTLKHENILQDVVARQSLRLEALKKIHNRQRLQEMCQSLLETIRYPDGRLARGHRRRIVDDIQTPLDRL